MSETLHSVPSIALLVELNARYQRSPVHVRPVGGPTTNHPVRHGVYREGDVMPMPHGSRENWKQRYIAICDREADADNIAALLNDQQAARERAAKE